jgi:hypothetical protein
MARLPCRKAGEAIRAAAVSSTASFRAPRRATKERTVTRKVGNVYEAQHRGKQARKEIKKANVAREAVKSAAARAKYRNAAKGQGKVQ